MIVKIQTHFSLLQHRFLGTSAWYNLVIAIDTTQSTSTDRAKLYVNGVQVTSFSTSNYPKQNADMMGQFTNRSLHWIHRMQVVLIHCLSMLI